MLPLVILLAACSSSQDLPLLVDATVDADSSDVVANDTKDSGAADVCIGPMDGATEPGCGGYIKGHSCTGCACAPGYYCTAQEDGGSGVCCKDGACGDACGDDCDCRSHVCGSDKKCR